MYNIISYAGNQFSFTSTSLLLQEIFFLNELP